MESRWKSATGGSGQSRYGCSRIYRKACAV